MEDLEAPSGFSLVEQDGLSWLEAPLAQGIARFTFAYDRKGREVDLGLPSPGNPDASARVTGNREAISRAMGFRPGSVALVSQVHGGVIRSVLRSEGDEGFAPATDPLHEADGMITTDGHTVLAVSVADCAAIAISGARGRALLHCGWRGLATNMIERSVEMVEGREAAIGPCIGPCCFEVGPEVSDLLGVERSDRGTIDIAAVASDRLRGAGVEAVGAAEVCTRCNSSSFFSFRRQGGSAGRQMAFFSPK